MPTVSSAKMVRAPTRYVRSRVFDSAGWDGFEVRPDDIIIATYPKCGTTWTQRIVGMLIFGSAAPFPVQESSPWPDFRLMPQDFIRETAASQTHRRFLKTHLPYDALPVYAGTKFIHVARDGRDSAMSFHNHMTGFTEAAHDTVAEISRQDPKFAGSPPPKPDPDPAVFFRSWLSGEADEMGDPGASFFHVENSYWAARRDPNMLLVHYNDMKADLEGEMRRIAAFLDIRIDETLWPGLVRAATFSEMKSKAAELMPSAGMLWDHGGDRFLHKGTNGRWQNVVSPEDLAAYEEKVKANFSPALASWLAEGRLKTGDPREAAA